MRLALALTLSNCRVWSSDDFLQNWEDRSERSNYRDSDNYKNTAPSLVKLGATGRVQQQKLLDRASEPVEQTADLVAQQGQSGDNDNSDQNEDERVLDEALALFLGEEAAKHCVPPED